MFLWAKFLNKMQKRFEALRSLEVSPPVATMIKRLDRFHMYQIYYQIGILLCTVCVIYVDTRLKNVNLNLQVYTSILGSKLSKNKTRSYS
jgi:hypothetical protein